MHSFHGVVPLLKPPGMTSHDAVAHVRRVLKTKRVGHTGTLDPAAAGVLPICVGQATRLVEALQTGTKGYLAEATFGYETDTLDAVGTTVRECDAAGLSREQLESVLGQFRGSIQQEPPLYSAIKVEGRRLYEIARDNENTGEDHGNASVASVSIPMRSVTVSALEVTRFFAANSARSQAHALIRVECSGGTYIRSLVRDIGRALGNAATMTFLTRYHNGCWDLSKTVTPQEFEQAPSLVPVQSVLERLYGVALLDEEVVLALSQGRRVQHELANENAERRVGPLLWSNGDQSLLALTFSEEGQLKPVKVFDLR